MKMKRAIALFLASMGIGRESEDHFLQPSTRSLNQMDIDKGFQIDQPNVFVPWDIDENTLSGLFKGYDLHHVTTGYFTLECTSLENLNCMIGFHFEPLHNGQLRMLEFSRMNYDNQQESFDEFQSAFVRAFGPPTSTMQGDEGFNDHQWRLNNVQIDHYVFDRFGPEERLSISRIP